MSASLELHAIIEINGSYYTPPVLNIIRPLQLFLQKLTTRFSLVNRLAGTTGVELVAGLHWYLKHWCGAHISWDKTGGSQLFSVPKPGFLPRVHDAGILVKRPVPWSYYQNAVTSSCKLHSSHLLFFVVCELKYYGWVQCKKNIFYTILFYLLLEDSFAWWDWERWEKEIDWMALQGVNLPLAFTGQEAIWQKVFKVLSSALGLAQFLACV